MAIINFSDYGYKENSGFISNTKQITMSINSFEDTMDVDINVQTDELAARINELTETQHEDITNQTNIQHEDMTLQINTQHNDSVEMENELNGLGKTLTNLFGALAKTFKNIFTQEKGDDIEGESFYEMVQRENNETQQYLMEHTQTMKSESDESQKYFNDFASMVKTEDDELEEILNKIVEAQNNQTKTITSHTQVMKEVISEAIKSAIDSGTLNFNALEAQLKQNGIQLNNTLTNDIVSAIISLRNNN